MKKTGKNMYKMSEDAGQEHAEELQASENLE